MFVTPSLAHGAVREAVRLSSEKSDRLWDALSRTQVGAPSTYRRFGEWFRKYHGLHEQAALLIVFGKIGRRRGALSAFTPVFEEVEGGWDLDIRRLSMIFSPGRLEHIGLERLPVTIAGHALERMFQRTDSIQWLVVRDCLASATLLLSASVSAYITAGCKQCAVPAEKGLLVGQVVEGKLALRTFLPEREISPKWRMLLSDLNAFIARHKLAIETSALTPDDEAATALKAVLTSRKYNWLFEPYVRGVDSMESAWRSRGPAVDVKDPAPTKSA